MKSYLFGIVFFCTALAAAPAAGNTSPESWVYMTVEDLVNGERRFEGEYSAPPAKGQSDYKDPLEMVYEPVRTDGDKKSDISAKAWGMVCDGELYVNNKALGGGKGYSKSCSAGRYNLFFVQVKESGSSRQKYGYTQDDIRFYGKEQGKHRGTVTVSGIPIGLGSSTLVYIPVIIDGKNGEMKAYSQAYMQELGSRHPGVDPVPMNEARGERLIEYFKKLNSLK